MLGDSYDSATLVGLNETCILFYDSGGNITFALKLRIVSVNVSIGTWKVELGIPYLDTSNSVAVSIDAPGNTSTTRTPESHGICGPAFLVGLTLVPVLLRRHD
ncbi:CGP-CTERM sorting domain-containing protein [Thermococcus sp.]|uniref:CGP-CTERM sorting domain-containing protein n=1 Tax=Thermococcus sp. TaxID=35749 RepID=UPI0026286F9D|nr:CGP-CTERM sorting domain-containing protein [Thermococcus sp.]